MAYICNHGNVPIKLSPFSGRSENRSKQNDGDAAVLLPSDLANGNGIPSALGTPEIQQRKRKPNSMTSLGSRSGFGDEERTPALSPRSGVELYHSRSDGNILYSSSVLEDITDNGHCVYKSSEQLDILQSPPCRSKYRSSFESTDFDDIQLSPVVSDHHSDDSCSTSPTDTDSDQAASCVMSHSDSTSGLALASPAIFGMPPPTPAAGNNNVLSSTPAATASSDLHHRRQRRRFHRRPPSASSDEFASTVSDEMTSDVTSSGHQTLTLAPSSYASLPEGSRADLFCAAGRHPHRRCASPASDVIRFHNLDNVAVADLYQDGGRGGRGRRANTWHTWAPSAVPPPPIPSPSVPPLRQVHTEPAQVAHGCGFELCGDLEQMECDGKGLMREDNSPSPVPSPTTPALWAILCPAPDTLKPLKGSGKISDSSRRRRNGDDRKTRPVFFFGDDDDEGGGDEEKKDWDDNGNERGGVDDNLSSDGNIERMPADSEDEVLRRRDSTTSSSTSCSPNNSIAENGDVLDDSLIDFLCRQPIDTGCDNESIIIKGPVIMPFSEAGKRIYFSEAAQIVGNELSSAETTSLDMRHEDEYEFEASTFAGLFRRCRIERDSDSARNNGDEAKSSSSVLESMLLTKSDRCLLCAERVSQMTKTYNDIEAVTRLLEEKERDLELAARIGQTLLSKNKDLASRTETLEEQLSATNDKVFQLRHDLTTKEELLRFYNEDLANEGSRDASPSEEKEKDFVNLDLLQKKVQTLEDENGLLKSECTDLKYATETYEEKEKKLIDECVKQMAEVNNQVETFSQELQFKNNENAQQREEISLFMAKITERQKKINQLTIDNLDLHEKLTVSTDSQRKLTKELGCMQDRYDEMFERLEEMQDEMCLLRGKQKIRANNRHHHNANTFPPDSLASELETSLQQELSQVQSNRRAQSWKVFETAKAAKRAIAKASSRHSASPSASFSTPSQWDSDATSNFSTYTSDVESMNSDGYSADMDSVYESNAELGRPGIPGSDDLESALRSLALTSTVDKVDGRIFDQQEDECLKKKLIRLESRSPISGRTSPGGASSTSSLPGYATSSISSSQGFGKMSDKLQIVKPLEGSMTLRHWQQLATPHLGGIFEQRDGVQMKSERKVDLKEDNYSLSDFEEDDDPNASHTTDKTQPGLSFTDNPQQYSGSFNGLGALLDPRTPSPSLLSLRSSPPSSDSSKSMQTSTPRLAKNNDLDPKQKTTPGGFMGLAELLSKPDNSAISRALMRSSSLSGDKGGPGDNNISSAGVSSSLASSNNLINVKALLSRSVNCLPQAPSSSPATGSPSARIPSAYKNLPGSRSLEEVSSANDEAVATKSASNAAPAQNPKLFAPDMTGRGFLQQLKNRGYTLYGLWSGAANPSSPSHSEDNKQTSSSSLSSSSFGSAHASIATGLNLNTSTGDVDGDGGDSQQVSASTILPPDAETGILGAMTNLRRGGLL